MATLEKQTITSPTIHIIPSFGCLCTTFSGLQRVSSFCEGWFFYWHKIFIAVTLFALAWQCVSNIQKIVFCLANVCSPEELNKFLLKLSFQKWCRWARRGLCIGLFIIRIKVESNEKNVLMKNENLWIIFKLWNKDVTATQFWVVGDMTDQLLWE